MWQIAVSTTAEAEDAVACLLERRFQTPASVYWDEKTGKTRATVYIARLPHPTAARTSLQRELGQLKQCGLDPGPARVSVKIIPRENWAESWKRHFKPIDIEGALLVRPGWSRKRPRPGQRVIILDPGLSFGTGRHPTTFFCLRQLVRCRVATKRQTFLDIGAGSGILAIAAAKLGYASVQAFDNDPASVKVSRANVRRNRVQDRVSPRRQDLTRLPLTSARKYDVICANLTADLLASQAKKIATRLRPDGHLIVAGILRREFQSITKILQRFGLTLVSKMSDKEWESGQFVLLLGT